MDANTTSTGRNKGIPPTSPIVNLLQELGSDHLQEALAEDVNPPFAWLEPGDLSEDEPGICWLDVGISDDGWVEIDVRHSENDLREETDPILFTISIGGVRQVVKALCHAEVEKRLRGW